MGTTHVRIERRRRWLERIEKLFANPADALVIHYSCENFDNRPDGRSPRVTSIAVKELDSGSTKSFSIHKVAEQEDASLSEIKGHYDDYEKKMLDAFFSFVDEHRDKTWVHWNMRDASFGFEALEHRGRVLGCTPVSVPGAKRLDLARALVGIYGVRYAPHPRLSNLVRVNRIGDIGFMPGDEEPKAFERGDYPGLHRSTLRKVDIIANLAERVADGSLKTKARLWHVYGLRPAGVLAAIRDHWLYRLFALVGLLLSLAFGMWRIASCQPTPPG